jgi:hypothetical protein
MSMLLFALLAVAAAAGPAAAQDRLDAVAAAVDRATSPPAETAAVERMATFLGTTPEALRAERASARLGWGDLFVSHRIAARGGHPIEKVFAARRTGAPWGDIASDARVEPDLLVQDVAALWPEAARAAPAAGDAARPASPPPPPSDGRVPGPPAPGPAASAPAAPPAPPEAPKGLGSRVLDFLRGAPSEQPEAPAADRTQEEIRDRMIRGGGSRSR